MTTSTRNAPVAATVAMLLLGLAFAAVGAVYVTATAAHLPSFFPGHQTGSGHHHTKHALIAFGLALLCWIGAWFSTGSRRTND